MCRHYLRRLNVGLVIALLLVACLIWPTAFTQAQSTPSAEQSAAPAAATAARPTRVGWLRLAGSLSETPSPFAWAAQDDEDPTLAQVIEQLQHVAGSDRYAGVTIYLDDPALGFSQVCELAAAMDRVRAAGKHVLVFSEAYDLLSYLLACCADQVLLQHKGQIILPSLAMEEWYFAGLFEKIGAQADLLQIGRFKGALEPYTRTEPSDEWNQNIDGLLDDLYAQVIGWIAQRRGLTADQVEQAMADTWAMKDQDYLDRRLVDVLVDRDLTAATGPTFGNDFTWDRDMGIADAMPASISPFALFQRLLSDGRQKITRDTIMLVHASGVIHRGRSNLESHQAGVFGGGSIGSRTMVKLLGEARDDPHVRAVVIRIDSPGGSALASDVIWQAIHQTAEAKPLFVSVSSTAASGGYYLASAAHEIYVNDSSIVGSIGVVGGKLIFGGLYDKIGLSVHRRSRGPLGDMFNSAQPFTDQQREAVLASMQQTYDTFVDRVQTGRGRRIGDISQVAEGRLFTGRQAVENGLADRLGGVDQAIADLVSQLGLVEGQYDVIERPGPMSLPEYLDQLFETQSPDLGLAQNALAATSHLLGEQRWLALQQVLCGLLLLSGEPILALTPYAIVIH